MKCDEFNKRGTNKVSRSSREKYSFALQNVETEKNSQAWRGCRNMKEETAKPLSRTERCDKVFAREIGVTLFQRSQHNQQEQEEKWEW